jgi:hypothetical protein
MKRCVECGVEIFGQKVKYCSNACKQKHHYHRVKKQTNTYHSQTIRAIRRKLQLIDLKGGKCESCGYNKNLAALHFHHAEPHKKKFKLDMRMLSNRKWDAISQEVKKCILLCANCHSEVHSPELSFENAKRIASGAPGRKLSGEQGVNSGKP